MSPHACNAVQSHFKRPERLAAIIACQNTQVVTQTTDDLDKVPHGALIQVNMHVTDMKYGEPIKRWRQFFELQLIVLDTNAFCISPPAPIETSQLQGGSNDRMDRIPVLDVKEVYTLTEDLRFMVRLDSQSQSCM